jgi:hypothetical protein
MAGGEHIGATEGMGEAREAFQSAMEAESPTKSRQAPDEKKREEKVDIDDLFPTRKMDRREREGGLDAGDPEPVRKARAEARGNADTGEVDDGPPPSDDDELDEDEDDATPPQQDEDDDQHPDDEDEGDAEGLNLNTIVEVNIDGQPAEITLKEAIRGYIRTETFHRRLGDLQTGVQQLLVEKNEVAQTREAYLERAQALEEYVNAFLPKEPNWDELYAADPGNAARLEPQWRSLTEKIQGLGASKQQAQYEAEQARMQNLHNFANANRAKLASAHPEWKNEKVWKRDHDSMRRTARVAGYTDEEINQLYDARGVEVLLKAAAYDRLMAAKPKPVQNGPGNPTKRNGATPRPRAVSRSFDRAEKRLSRSGSIGDAANVFEKILDRER